MRWLRMAVVAFACLSFPAAVLFSTISDRRTVGRICQAQQQNYDSITRILDTGNDEPLVAPEPVGVSDATVLWVAGILSTVNARTENQNVDIDKVRGPRPTC